MKPHALVLAGVVTLILAACATLGLRRGCVNIGDTYVEIHPGTNIASADEAALRKILSQYESKLYWIRKKDGQNLINDKGQGQLSEIYISEALLDEQATGEQQGISYSAIQIGARSAHVEHSPHVDHTPVVDHSPHVNHTPHVDHTPVVDHSPHVDSHLSREDFRKCSELVKRVTPILQKYSCK